MIENDATHATAPEAPILGNSLFEIYMTATIEPPTNRFRSDRDRDSKDDRDERDRRENGTNGEDRKGDFYPSRTF